MYSDSFSFSLLLTVHTLYYYEDFVIFVKILVPYTMKRTLFVLSVFLLLFIGNIGLACAQRPSFYEVVILSSEGKPQPDIYAYYDTSDNERKYFKSDANGMMIITPDSANWITKMKFDEEKNKGYHAAVFNLYYKQKDTLIYNTRKDLERMLGGKVYQCNDCDERPEFPGGANELMKFLGKNINYPPISQCDFQVRILVQCVIDKDGSVKDAKVIRPGDAINNDYYVRESVRVVSSMPKWKPGKVGGKPVACLFTIPVMFRLQ